MVVIIYTLEDSAQFSETCAMKPVITILSFDMLYDKSGAPVYDHYVQPWGSIVTSRETCSRLRGAIFISQSVNPSAYSRVRAKLVAISTARAFKYSDLYFYITFLVYLVQKLMHNRISVQLIKHNCLCGYRVVRVICLVFSEN